MKDDFKGVVPAPSTPSRRVTPQPSGSSRRPSDGSSNSNVGRGSPSPRAKAHAVRDAGAAIGSVDARATSPTSPTRESATFITALAVTKPLGSQRRSLLDGNATTRANVLRPPSPLEAADADRARETTKTAPTTGEPMVANYVGTGALGGFWRLFQREETVHNHSVAAVQPPRPASPTQAPPRTRGSASKRNYQQDHPPPLLVPLSDRPRSARSTYLAAVRKLHLTPEPMGIVRRRAPDKGPSSSVGATTSSALACSSGVASASHEINLSSYCMGDVYATAFSESFALVPGVEVVNLASNRISDAVAARLVGNLVHAPVPVPATATLQSLNLSHNALGASAARALAELLKTSRALTSLNVAHNHLKDRDIAVLCDALQKNQTLAKVHLSENRFGIPGMVAIAKFLEENAKIEEVYLAWNNLRGLGALKVVEALKFHASIRVLDLSWNALDSNEQLKPRAIVTALGDALANNKVLAHLDLSNNHLDRDDCALLAKQLEHNHTLIGLHMSGNCGAMDSRGFLIANPSSTHNQLLDQHKMYSIAVFEETMSDSGSGVFPAHVTQLVDRFCWYCGQWSEHRFAWTPPPDELPSGATTQSVVVRVHVSHDDWRGVDMERREDGSYSAYLVLPPGKTEYFFTILDRTTDRVSHHYSPDKRHVKRIHVQQHNMPAEVFGALAWVNVLRNARRDGRDPCNTLTPRSTGKGLGERVAKWDINRSVFARRRRESAQRNFVDTDAFVSKACSADWRQCKVDRFVKDPARRKEVELCVTRHYRAISNVYRKYCGHNVLTSVAVVAALTPAVAMQIQNDVISVPWSGYMEFLTECKILDESSDYCRYADCENVFVAANLELTQEAKEKDNPDRSLTRFEFLEVVMRIAMNKYLRTNVCDSPAKAVEKLVVDHLVPNCPEDPNDFRQRFLYTEEISDIFSEHIVLLQDVYNSNMGRYCKPGEKKGMQLAEFLTVMERYQVYSDAFKIRDVKDPFLACKLVVLDEMATVGHKKLLLTDFMELLLRVAVLRYPPTKPTTVVDVARSLQKLIVNHFLKHEALLDQFRETVDQVMAQQRIEEFAEAINAQKRQSTGRKSSHHRGSASARLSEESDGDDDSDEDDMHDEGASQLQPQPPSQPEEATSTPIAEGEKSQQPTDEQPVSFPPGESESG